MWWRDVLAFYVMLPAGATVYFFVFWNWFEYWRRRRLLTYALVGVTFTLLGGLIVVLRSWTYAGRLDMPVAALAVGWALIAVATVFGTIADRQIGVSVRTFTPFFEQQGHLELRTSGAYGVVRHPIYAAGSVFQAGGFLVTGYPAVLVSWVVFTGGALWFTAQEERRLVALLDDPQEYDRYRERVPALFPRWRPR